MDCNNNSAREVEEITGVDCEADVKIISLTLITKRTVNEKGEEEVKREHRWEASRHYNFDRFNWEEFVVNVDIETFAHLDEIRNRPSTVKVTTVDDN